MTAREKLAIEYPEKLDDLEPGGCMGCPEDYGYLPDADFCTNCYGDVFERCKKCWDREIPEETKEEKENCMSDCLYKFYKEHPNAKDPVIQGMCPDEFSYLDPPENCNCLHGSSEFPELMSCSDCWHREIPEEMKEEKGNVMSECSMKIQCNNCIHEEVCCLKGTLLNTKNELEHIEIPAFLQPIKLECTHYSPKNRTFTK